VHVLIADDDRATAEALSRTLERWGFKVTVKHNGADAWEILRGPEAPALAILDWMMPEIDGREVCRLVRQEAAHPNAYLILLTSRDSRTDIVAGLESGADDYLVKPFDPAELQARIHVGTRMLNLQDRLESRVKELQLALSEVKQLSGLLPICSYCKRVRSDDNYWHQVDAYIAHHTDAKFSHGICPPCFDTISKEIDEYAKRDPSSKLSI
jgi:sigma-B regulation protein RsbU (phosphoserine phosphatase)